MIRLRRLLIGILICVVLLCSLRFAGADGSITGYGRIEKITGNPSMGYKELYEWDLFLSPPSSPPPGPFRRLGAPPGEPPTGNGYYRIDGMPAGTYSVYVNQPDFFASPKVVPNVQIKDGQTTNLDVILDVDYSSYFFPELSEWTDWYWDLYQTFKATGTSVRGVSWIMAGTDGNTGEVRVLEDNGQADIRNWKQVGFGTDQIGSNSDEWVRWISGEVPLIPGKQYAVHIHVDGGMAIYKRNKDANSYAFGQAYDNNGNPKNYDLNITVFVDRNHQIVTHTRKSPKAGNEGEVTTRWSQSFVATGTSLAAADVFTHTNGSNFFLVWRIRKGSPNGPQIGPVKTIYGAYWGPGVDLVGVSYNPWDVPLVPGEVYFVEVSNPSPFKSRFQEPWWRYNDGAAYRDGVGTDEDLAMTIVEYDYPLPPRSCDMNDSDRVDTGDFFQLNQQWGLTNDIFSSDFNRDLVVSRADFDIFISHWMKRMNGLVGHWLLDESSSTTAWDFSGENKQGTLYNFPGDHSQWGPGKIGGGLTFDGVEDYVTIDGYQGIMGADSRTVSAWIRTTKVPGSILTWGRAELGEIWMFYVHTDGTLKANVWGGFVTGSTPVNDGGWHHVAAVLAEDGSPNATDIRLYVDGNPETISSSLALGINTQGTDEVQVGRLNSEYPGFYFGGQMDDVRMYDRALDDGEIQVLYEVGLD